ncbi:hypothetical protein [Thiocapsa rosea]|nr:hypothetical protein [Thiocapsa rosea]
MGWPTRRRHSNCASTWVHLKRSFVDLASGEVAVSQEPVPDSPKQYVGVT